MMIQWTNESTKTIPTRLLLLLLAVVVPSFAATLFSPPTPGVLVLFRATVLAVVVALPFLTIGACAATCIVSESASRPYRLRQR